MSSDMLKGFLSAQKHRKGSEGDMNGDSKKNSPVIVVKLST